ncbi:hypothetical protein KSS87_001462, partial [Heliosperma pusillum]
LTSLSSLHTYSLYCSSLPINSIDDWILHLSFRQIDDVDVVNCCWGYDGSKRTSKGRR